MELRVAATEAMRDVVVEGVLGACDAVRLLYDSLDNMSCSTSESDVANVTSASASVDGAVCDVRGDNDTYSMPSSSATARCHTRSMTCGGPDSDAETEGSP